MASVPLFARNANRNNRSVTWIAPCCPQIFALGLKLLQSRNEEKKIKKDAKSLSQTYKDPEANGEAKLGKMDHIDQIHHKCISTNVCIQYAFIVVLVNMEIEMHSSNYHRRFEHGWEAMCQPSSAQTEFNRSEPQWEEVLQISLVPKVIRATSCFHCCPMLFFLSSLWFA